MRVGRARGGAGAVATGRGEGAAARGDFESRESEARSLQSGTPEHTAPESARRSAGVRARGRARHRAAPEPQREDTVPLRLCWAEVKGEELAAVLDGVRVHPSS
jgi:hypothetical protein